MEGDHLVPVSSFVMGKWIVRERSVEPHLCLDSSISLFIFPPHGQGGLPNSQVRVRASLFDVWMHCKPVTHSSLKFNTYSIADM